ncbi:MAG TPA: LytTR family DNA-binding domain-containing protein [Vicinamibacterales bacterium]|nr:LytTR family DNA-binding domain-containing protein [Vicinamibacterales bacterium]
MTLRAFVLDDEALAVKRLTKLLDETGRLDIVGSDTDPVRALTFLDANAVDVLFLDIQMPGLTGFELLERVKSPGREPFVIFTTAYDRYALNAFAVNSIDYLLKPIERERLAHALDKLERIRGGGAQGAEAKAPDIRAIARQLAAELSPQRRLDRIASKVGERTTILDIARVTHFFSKDKLTFAVVDGREHVIDVTLTDLESRLDPRRFVRIHRAALVNLGFVEELFPGVDGGLLVRLKDGRKTELSVARDRARELKDRLGI